MIETMMTQLGPHTQNMIEAMSPLEPDFRFENKLHAHPETVNKNNTTVVLENGNNSNGQQKNKSSFHMDGRRMSHERFIAVFNQLQHSTTLEELRITSAFKGHEEDKVMTALGQMLSKNSTLQKVYLTTPPLSFHGAMALANGLKHNSTLKVFHVKDSVTGEVDVLVNLTNDCHHWEDTFEGLT